MKGVVTLPIRAVGGLIQAEQTPGRVVVEQAWQSLKSTSLRDAATASGMIAGNLAAIATPIKGGAVFRSSQSVQEARAVEQLAAKGTPLTFDKAARTWTTPEGLIYTEGSAQGNRIKHVLEHTVPNPAKPVHSVFDVGRSEVLGVVDEAWTLRQGPGILQKNGNRLWDVDMGRVVGTSGQTSVRVIVQDGTTQIITAFPR